MATKTNAGKAAGQAAALPTMTALTAQLANASLTASNLHSGLAYDLKAVLNALEHLADCMRVLNTIEDYSNNVPALADTLHKVCPTWRSPMRGEHGIENLQDLARLGITLCDDLATKSEALEALAWSADTAVNARQPS
jgi:hypothetical protein